MRPFALVLLLFAPTALFACTTSGSSKSEAGSSVQGVVADPSGAVLAGVKVNLDDKSYQNAFDGALIASIKDTLAGNLDQS